jgi:type I restriction enzyme S subunit
MEGRELPIGWEVANGSDMFELVTSGSRGWAKYYSDDGPLFIRIGNLDHDSIELDLRDVQHVRPPVGSEGNRTRLEPNDILISITAELGMVALVPEGLGEAYVNQHVALARPSSEIDARFLAWYLASESDGKHQLLEAKRGATKVGLGLPDIRNLILPLAPLNEQRRIAAKLDTTLAAVEACRQRLDGVAAILKRFRQAVLTAATSGELTREWREERGLADSWKTKVLSEIADSRLGKMLDQRKNTGHLTPYLRNINVRWFSFDLEDIQEIRLADTEIIDLDVRFGDLLVCEGGEPGRCAVWRGEDSKYTFQKALHRVRTSKHLLADYLSFCLSNSANNGKLEQLFTGSTIKHLTGASLKKLQILLPSREEQEEIVDRVESLYSLADQLEARLTAARKVVDRLTPALLAKAFRGELVPQDPTDEPASVLLERIRAARQAEAGAGKPSRRGRPKAAANPDQLPLDAAPVPPDFLAALLRECGALSERALLAVSELEPQRFQQQLYRELESGTAREVQDNGQVLLEAVG